MTLLRLPPLPALVQRRAQVLQRRAQVLQRRVQVLQRRARAAQPAVGTPRRGAVEAAAFPREESGPEAAPVQAQAQVAPAWVVKS